MLNLQPPTGSPPNPRSQEKPLWEARGHPHFRGKDILRKIFPLEILLLFVFSRLIIFGLGVLAFNIFPKYDQPAEYVITNHGAWQSPSLKLPLMLREITPLGFGHWHKFDSLWYEGIALKGYDSYKSKEKHPQANWLYFPLYPLLLSLLSNILDIRVAGIVVSNILFYFSLLLFHEIIVLRTHDRALGLRGVFYLLIFPTSIFFSLTYTESLFLFLTIAGFFFMDQKKYGWASLAASLAAVTRIPGFLLGGIIILKYLREQGLAGFKRPGKEILYFFFIPLPLLVFLFYMWGLTGDFLAPFREHRNWAGRTFAFPFLNWYRYLTQDPYFIYHGGWDLGILSFLILTGSLLTLFLGYKRISGLMFLYSFLHFLILSVSYPSLVSFTRYVSVIFPLYIIWASFSQNRVFDCLFTFSSLVLWTFYVIAFINNYYFVV